jgi:hypothetical protein
VPDVELGTLADAARHGASLLHEVPKRVRTRKDGLVLVGVWDTLTSDLVTFVRASSW